MRPAAALVEVQGLTARQAGYRPQRLNNTLYEYQWKLNPREATRAGRDSNHLPSPEVLDPILQEEGESLHQRFDRARFQNEFQARSRAASAAYIVRALRELGWTPAVRGAADRDAGRSIGYCAAISPVAPADVEGVDRAGHCFDGGPSPPLEGAMGRLPGMSGRAAGICDFAERSCRRCSGATSIRSISSSRKAR